MRDIRDGSSCAIAKSLSKAQAVNRVVGVLEQVWAFFTDEAVGGFGVSG